MKNKVPKKSERYLLFLALLVSAAFFMSFTSSTAQSPPSCNGLPQQNCTSLPASEFCQWVNSSCVPKGVGNTTCSFGTVSLNFTQAFDFESKQVRSSGNFSFHNPGAVPDGVLGDPDITHRGVRYVNVSGNLSQVLDCAMWINESDLTYRHNTFPAKGSGMVSNDIFCVNYENTGKYAKIKIKSFINATNVVFDYVYQNNGSNIFCEQGGAPPTTTILITTTTMPGPGNQSCGPLNMTQCQITLGCLWNGTSCVQGGPGQGCANITNESICNSIGECMWNASQQKCGPKENITTTTLLPMTSTTTVPGGTTTIPVMTTTMPGGGQQPNCPSYNESVCMQTPGCFWENNQQSCKYQMMGFDCHQFSNDSVQCLNHTQENCYWVGKGLGGECVFLDPNQPHCFMFDENETGCNETEGCEWVTQGNDTYCGPAGMGYCSQFNNNQSACVSDPQCLWVTDYMANQSSCGVNMGGGMNPECQVNCSKCTDPGMCGGSTKGCHWNFTANPNRCEDGQMQVNPCQGHGSQECNAIFGCWYDANYSGLGYGECVVDTRMNVTGCASYPINESCEADQNCNWGFDERDNKWKCMPAGGSDCPGRNNPYDCEIVNYCVWDYGFGKCYSSLGGGVCEGISDKYACQGTAGCKWDDYQWRCVSGSIVNCSAQGTQQLCNMYGECKWNGTSCSLSECAGNCSACATTDACMKSPTGCWWDFGMARCNKNVPPSCEGGMCDMCNTTADCYNTTLHPTNLFCGWFGNVSQAPGYRSSPAKALGLLQGSEPYEPNCRMNTSCAQDCFSCQSEVDCLASNNSAFNHENKSNPCSWDPMSSWNPCFPTGQGGGSPCNANCSQCGDEGTCRGSPMGCVWNTENSPPCGQSDCFTLGCSYCGSMDNCMRADGKWREQNATGCVWWHYDNGTETCRNRECDTECFKCLTQTGCQNSGAGCQWNNQTEQCVFTQGSSAGCNGDCSLCPNDGFCWGSYAGCRWIYEGHWYVGLSNGQFILPPGQGGAFTIRSGEALRFASEDNETYNLTIDDYLGEGFPVEVSDIYGTSDIYFDTPGTYVIYDTINGKDVMNMTLVVTSDETRVCVPNDCKQDCQACGDPGACQGSYAGCAWDYKNGNCVIAGSAMTCDKDCYACDSAVKCNASNATMYTPSGQMSGCQWIFDPFDGRNTCRPKGISFDCATMCEMCNSTQCNGATPTMLPPKSPGCKWFPYEKNPMGDTGMCHPEGSSGMGSNCPQWDYTSKMQCEVNPGCRWDDVNDKCLIDTGSLGCDQMCKYCNQTKCQEKAPKCVWDTPQVGQPFCREDQFKPGGNCQQNCFDCYDNKSCSESAAECRWVKDIASPMGYHCQPQDMPICEEECFACYMPADCDASNNSRPADKAATWCPTSNQSECELEHAMGNCNWTGSACVSNIPYDCEWDTQWMFCKPKGFTGEVCFIPGDEDGNGLADCKDPACNEDPFCSLGGGSMGMNIDCAQWDDVKGGNQSVCENYENSTETGCVWHIVTKPPFFNETEGLCDPKFSDMMFNGMGEDMPVFMLHDFCPQEPGWVTAEEPVLENLSFLDICEVGVRETESIMAFVMKLADAKDLALCNFLNLAESMNKSGKYFFLLDIDNNVSTGCGVQVNISEYDRTPVNFQFGEGGLEYRIDYEINVVNGSVEEVRMLYQCVNNTWTIKSAQMSGKKDKACEFESIYLGIKKSDIGNPVSTIHIIAFTADESGGWSSGILYAKDRAYHGYYTPGTMDFVPPDCSVDPMACGAGYDSNTGVMLFENCFPGTGDEDMDGKTNCEDEDCLTSIFCANGTAYDPTTDTTAPKITSSKVDTEQALAIIIWTTDEPATGIVQFYGTNDTCELGVQNVSQYNDVFFTLDDYTPTHVVPLDSEYPDEDYRLSEVLEPNTTYYYKIRSCDQAQVFNNATNATNPNCAVSACLSFTTKAPCESIVNETICRRQGICKWYANQTPNCVKEIEFGFDWVSNTSNPTDPLGGVTFQMIIGNTTLNMSAGTKASTNESGCDVTLKFQNEMTTLFGQKAPWTIEMEKCCVPRQTINLTDALQVANKTNESLYLGMDSGVWQQIAQIMGCKKVYMYLPGFHQDCRNISISHCDETGANCTLVSLDNATMTFCNSSVSVWELAGSDPTLFSSYTNEYGIDAYAPRILSGPTIGTVGGTSAVLSTVSNEDCNISVNFRECDMEEYNSTGSCAQFPENLTAQGRYVANSTMVKSHSVYLTNLTANTKYYYRVIATDASNNQRILDNQEVYYTFQTTGGALEQQTVLVVGWNLISLPLSS